MTIPEDNGGSDFDAGIEMGVLGDDSLEGSSGEDAVLVFDSAVDADGMETHSRFQCCNPSFLFV